MKIATFNIRRWGAAAKRRRLKKLIGEENFDMCMIQETKSCDISRRSIGTIWSHSNFDWASKNAVGQSGGLLSVWKEGVLEVMFSFSGDNF